MTISKTPTLQDNEKLRASEQNVCLYKGNQESKYKKGWIYLTDHRLCYVDDDRPEDYSIGLDLSQIESTEYTAKFVRSSGKITLALRHDQAVEEATVDSTWVCPICTFSNQLSKGFVFGRSALPTCLNCGVLASLEAIQASSISQPSPAAVDSQSKETVCPRCTFSNHPSLVECEMCGFLLKAKTETKVSLSEVVKLSFRSGGSRQFYGKLGEVLEESKETIAQTSKTSTPVLDTDTMAIKFGIHSIEEAANSKHVKGDAVMAEAFADLRALMSRAEEVIKLVEAYGNSDLAISLGIGTSISRETASGKKTFYHQLARELTDFFYSSKILSKEGGAMTLHDVYAVYNRSRGIELVSPHDLRTAVELADDLGLPIRLRKLHSGVFIVEEKLYIPTHERLVQWMSRLEPWQADTGVSAQDVSNHFGWSIYIATEELESADLKGHLCRDEQPQAVRYFVNQIRVPV